MRRLSLCHASQGQCHSGVGNRTSSHPTHRSSIPQDPGVLSQLPIPGEILASAAPRSGQGRVAHGGPKQRMRGKEPAHYERRSPPKKMQVAIPDSRNPNTEVTGKKMRMISQTLGMGWAHAVTIGNIPSLERFLAIAFGKCRYN